MAYTRVNWFNEGETGAKPINKTNLNNMDKGIADLDAAVGNTTNLNTNSKEVVGAINEVNEKYEPTILFENSDGVSSGQINLSDNYTNYEKIEVATNIGLTGIIYPAYTSQVRISTSIFIDTLYIFYLRGEFSNNKLTIQNNGTYYSNANHAENHKIYKIIGYKKI